jgi:putative membrane protein
MNWLTKGWRDIPPAQRRMIGALAIFLLLMQIDPPFPETGLLHHAPTFALVLFLPGTLRRWPLPNAAVLCIVLFFALHTIGGRWTYTDVPYDSWARALTGTTISEIFGVSRNHYDRLVHLSYGLLAVLPVYESLRRHFGLTHRVSLYIAVEAVLAVSALYEVFEWGLSIAAAGDLAARYNGQQGDIWDAQKDIALAFVGSLAAALWVVRRSRRKSDG